MLLRFAYIPQSNWAAVAAGVSNFTNGTVSVASAEAEMKKCDRNNNGNLGYKEVRRCLWRNRKSLGLNSPQKWNTAKWELAEAAVISKRGLRRSMRRMH